jgi:hypothetical protein
MRIWKFAPLPLLALVMACATYSVRYDFDSHATFASYKTFDWYAASRFAKDKGVKVDNPIMDRRVSYAVEKELNARGYKRETAADPDFLVTYYPVWQEKKYWSSTQLGWGYWGFRPFGINIGTSIGQEHKYKEGTIVLEIVDFKTNQMVWQSVAEGALTDLDSPEKADSMVAKAVHDMLNQFPPQKP